MASAFRIIFFSVCGTANATLAVLGTAYLVEMVDRIAPSWKPAFAYIAGMLWLLALIWPFYAFLSGPRIAAQTRMRLREQRKRPPNQPLQLTSDARES